MASRAVVIYLCTIANTVMSVVPPPLIHNVKPPASALTSLQFASLALAFCATTCGVSEKPDENVTWL